MRTQGESCDRWHLAAVSDCPTARARADIGRGSERDQSEQSQRSTASCLKKKSNRNRNRISPKISRQPSCIRRGSCSYDCRFWHCCPLLTSGQQHHIKRRQPDRAAAAAASRLDREGIRQLNYENESAKTTQEARSRRTGARDRSRQSASSTSQGVAGRCSGRLKALRGSHSRIHPIR